jgi:hypothetical protein
MQELDTAAKPRIMRMWASYHKKWAQRWFADVCSPHMTSHMLSGIAGIISSFVSAYYDPARATWTKIWHASIVAIAGYVALMIIVAIAKALTVSSKIDDKQESEIGRLRKSLETKTQEYIAAKQESVDNMRRCVDEGKKFISALEDLQKARSELANCSDAFHAEYAKNSQLRRDFERFKSNRLKEEWRKLEGEFHEIGGGSNVTIEALWAKKDNTGEFSWDLMGGWDEPSRQRFKLVMTDAGNMLHESKYVQANLSECLSESDVAARWFLVVCKLTNDPMKPTGTSFVKGQGSAVTGAIKDFPNKCILACAHLATQEKWPLPKEEHS